MIAADAEAALFSIKSFVAAMMAYYISLRIGFSQPVWAVTTVYVVSQPLSGAVLSKALFRMLGTFLGGAATVVLLPEFVNDPPVLTFVLALWLGFCVYLAEVDRTPRSYTFLLAGYTASTIGFPSVLVPDSIFNTAILRVQEIGIGIACASAIHGSILPRTVSGRLRQQINGFVASGEQIIRESLSGSRDVALDRERRRLAGAVNDIQTLSYHLAFDTERLLPPAGIVRALQDQLSWLLPLSASVEDQIAECARLDGGTPAEIEALLGRIQASLTPDDMEIARDETRHQLVIELEALEQSLDANPAWLWREMLLASLLARLAELIRIHQTICVLKDHVLSGSTRGLSPEILSLVRAASGRSLHRDHGLALRSGLGAMVAVSLVCAFWISTAWPSGATAALISGLACALFGTRPHPGIVIRGFFYGTLIGIATAAICGYAVLPRVTAFEMLVAVLAPPLLLFGSLLTRPALAPVALGAVIGLSNTIGLASTYQRDFSAFVNGSLAQIAGTGATVVIIDIFHVVGAETAFARLFRAGFRDIAARAEGRARDARRWTARMIDRIVLIAARSGPTGVHPAQPPYDALVGLRIGYLAGELRSLSATLSEGAARQAVHQALTGIAAHFRKIGPANHPAMADDVLRSIDRAIATFATDPQSEQRRGAMTLLTGLRRTLFPAAGAFGGEAE